MRSILPLFLSTIFIVQHGHDEIIWVDHFNDAIVHELPNGWSGRKKQANKYYQVAENTISKDQKYLSVVNDATDQFILKKIEVDIVQYPYLNWKWRVHKLPPHGDESQKKTCDVAASLNVVFVLKKWRPKTIKYTWSSSLPVETHTKSPYAFWPSRCDIIVLESGEEKKWQWVSEKRNLLDDYKILYNKKKVKSKFVKAIVIMSDGDNTKSVSAADYDEIFFSKN